MIAACKLKGLACDCQTLDFGTCGVNTDRHDGPWIFLHGMHLAMILLPQLSTLRYHFTNSGHA